MSKEIINDLIHRPLKDLLLLAKSHKLDDNKSTVYALSQLLENTKQKASMNGDSFTGIKDIDLSILLDLDLPSLLKACQTNRKIAELCKDEGLWRKKINKDYNLAHKPDELTWKKYYQQLYEIPKIIDMITEEGNYAFPLTKDAEINKIVVPYAMYFPDSQDTDSKFKVPKSPQDTLVYRLFTSDPKKLRSLILANKNKPSTGKKIINPELLAELQSLSEKDLKQINIWKLMYYLLLMNELEIVDINKLIN